MFQRVLSAEVVILASFLFTSCGGLFQGLDAKLRTKNPQEKEQAIAEFAELPRKEQNKVMYKCLYRNNRRAFWAIGANDSVPYLLDQYNEAMQAEEDARRARRGAPINTDDVRGILCSLSLDALPLLAQHYRKACVRGMRRSDFSKCRMCEECMLQIAGILETDLLKAQKFIDSINKKLSDEEKKVVTNALIALQGSAYIQVVEIGAEVIPKINQANKEKAHEFLEGLACNEYGFSSKSIRHRSRYTKLRVSALKKLIESSSPRKQDVLIKLLTEPEIEIWRLAVSELARSKPMPEPFIPRLVELLNDDKQPISMRVRSAMILGKLGQREEQAINPLLDLYRGTKEKTIRKICINGLSQANRKNGEVVSFFVNILKEDTDISEEAADVLDNSWPQPVLAELQRYKKRQQRRKSEEGKELIKVTRAYLSTKQEMESMDYELKYKTPSDERQRKLEELKQFAAQEFMPIARKFKTLINNYNSKYGGRELRDLMIRHNLGHALH